MLALNASGRAIARVPLVGFREHRGSLFVKPPMLRHERWQAAFHRVVVERVEEDHVVSYTATFFNGTRDVDPVDVARCFERATCYSTDSDSGRLVWYDYLQSEMVANERLPAIVIELQKPVRSAVIFSDLAVARPLRPRKPEQPYNLERPLTHLRVRALLCEWDAEHCRLYLLLFSAAVGGESVSVDIEEPTEHLSRQQFDAVIANKPEGVTVAKKEIDVFTYHLLGARDYDLDFSSDFEADVCVRDVEQLTQCAVEETGTAARGVGEIWSLYDPKSGLHEMLKSKGAGVRIALLDSGVDAAHPDVRRQLRGFKSFVANHEEVWVDPNGHGTNCASIITAVAPDCHLFVGKVLFHSRKTPSRVAALCDAIYWAVNEVRCNVISISAGTSAYSVDLCTAINHAIDTE